MMDRTQNAKAFRGQAVEKIVHNISPQVNWFDDGKHCWYWRQTQDGDQCVVVDTTTGKTETIEAPPATDHLIESAERSLSPNQQWQLQRQNHQLQLWSHADDNLVCETHDGEAHFAYAKSPDISRIPLMIELGMSEGHFVALWSADSRYCLTHQLDERQVNPLPIIQNVPEKGIRPRAFTLRYSLAEDQRIPMASFVLVDTQKQTIKRLDIDPLIVEFFSPLELSHWVLWNQAGNRFYYLRMTRGYRSLSLCEYDCDQGVERTLIEESAATYIEPNQLFFWDNHTQVLDNRQEIIWLSERSNWSHLYQYDLNHGALKKPLTEGDWNVLSIEHVDEESGWLYFIGCGRESGDPYFRYLYRVHLDDGNLELLTPACAEHCINFSPNSVCFIDTYSTIDSAPTTELRQCDGQLLQTLETADITALENMGWQKPEQVVFKAMDGKTDCYGAIYKPSDFDPTKTYPVIEDIYPGPHNIHVAKAFSCDGDSVATRWPGMWGCQSLAECGFIVVTVDVPGTPMRSKAFHDVSYGQLQTGQLDEHVSALKQLAQERPYMDLNRVGITGHSAGGYIAARALLTHNDFYRVAVSIAGVHTLALYMNFWVEKYQGLYQTGCYENTANAALAGQLQGKLLLMHGDIDDNVHLAGTLQFVDALIKADKDFDMLIIPNEFHNCEQHPYVVKRQWQYFIDHL